MKKFYNYLIAGLLVYSAIMLVIPLVPTVERNLNFSLDFKEETSAVKNDVTVGNDVITYSSISNMCDTNVKSSTCATTVKSFTNENISIVLNEYLVDKNIISGRKISYLYFGDSLNNLQYVKEIESLTGRSNAIATDFIVVDNHILVSIVEYNNVNELYASYITRLDFEGNIVDYKIISSRVYHGGIKSMVKVDNGYVIQTLIPGAIHSNMILKLDNNFKLLTYKTVPYNLAKLELSGNLIKTYEEVLPYAGSFLYTPTSVNAKEYASLNELFNNPYKNFIGPNGFITISHNDVTAIKQEVLTPSQCMLDFNGTYKNGKTVAVDGKTHTVAKGCFLDTKQVYYDIELGHVISGLLTNIYTSDKGMIVISDIDMSDYALVGSNKGLIVFKNINTLSLVTYNVETKEVLSLQNTNKYATTINNKYVYKYKVLNNQIYCINPYSIETVGY